MRYFPATWSIENIAAYLKRQAMFDLYDGIPDQRSRSYLYKCTAAHLPGWTCAILTRDIGHHSSGWWKNPDYERCWHLSLSFRDPANGALRTRDKELTQQWIEAVFGETKNLIWAEPPTYPEGKKNDTWHYRVFWSEGWKAPLLPRGEVYTREFTPANWLSYSDLRESLRKREEANQ